MPIKTDIQRLEPGALVELYVLDATMLTDADGVSGTIARFHSGLNQLGAPVTWQGQVYSPYPMKASGFEWNGRGQSPRPKVEASALSGLLTAEARRFDYFIGATFTRKRTLAKYLDVINFPGGVNPTADPTAAFPDDVFIVERKTAENKLAIEWELSAATDFTGVKLPRRQVVANVCAWQYRSAECGYAGAAVAKADDTPTSDPALDVCGKRLKSCKLRFGTNSPLPYGGFPGAGRFRLA